MAPQTSMANAAPAAFELYVSPSPNVLKVLIALEEFSLSYRLRPVDVWKGEQFGHEITRLNPNAKVPILVDWSKGNAEGHAIFESGAILVYLAEKAGMFLPGSGKARYDVLQWLFFQAAGLGPIGGQFNHFVMFAEKGNDYSLSRYATELYRLYGVMDARLAGAPFFGGDRYSIADMAVLPWVRNQSRRFSERWPFVDIERNNFANLRGWFERVLSRPPVGRAVAAFDSIASTLASATQADLDRVLGRGEFALSLATPSPEAKHNRLHRRTCN